MTDTALWIEIKQRIAPTVAQALQDQREGGGMSMVSLEASVLSKLLEWSECFHQENEKEIEHG